MKNVKKIFYFLFLCLAFQYSYSQWESKNNGLNTADHQVACIESLIISGDTIFAGTYKGIYFTLDDGDSWHTLDTTIQFIYSLAIDGDNIVAANATKGIYISTDRGKNWAFNKISISEDKILSVAVKGNNIYAGSDGLFISSNLGYSWQQKLWDAIIWSFASNSNNIFAVGRDVFLSTDNGVNWILQNNGFPDTVRSAISINEGNIYVGSGSYGRVFLSTNKGENWTDKSNGLPNHNGAVVNALASCENYVFASILSSPNGLFFSTNKGDNWVAKSSGLPIEITPALLIHNDFVFAGTCGHGVYRAHISELLDVKDSPTPSDEIALFPNPARDYIGIEIAEYSGMIEGANYSILNLLGQTMQSGTLAEAGDVQGECRISVESLPTGIYFLILKDSKAGTFVPLKFIKQ